MKEIVVLGAGLSGRALIEKIREKDSGSKITVIDKNFNYFSKKDLINSLSFKDCLDIKSWAQDKNIEFIGDHVERINPKNKKIYFKESEVKEFDILVVACGLKSKKISIKGEQKEGVFYLSQMGSLKLKSLLKISSEAVVYVSTFLGCQLALALNSLGKEVKIIAGSLDFLGDNKERMTAFFSERNIGVYLDAVIEETIGEGIVRAVKTAPLKVFSSQLVFLDSGFLPNCDFFEADTISRDTFFTNYEAVYFLGDINNADIGSELFFPYNWEEAREQGSILADFLMGAGTTVFQRRKIKVEDKNKIIESFLLNF